MRVPPTKFFSPFMRKWGMNFPSLPKLKTCSSLAESIAQSKHCIEPHKYLPLQCTNCKTHW
jgi:hypothetical protein